MRSEKKDVPSRTQQVRRQDILFATVQVINDAGYAAASIATIAKRAHTSKSTVLYHFASKEELMRMVVGSIYEDGAAYMKPQIDAAMTLPDKLHAYITSNIEYIALHTAQIAAIHTIVMATPHADLNDEPVLLLQQMFEAGQATGVFGGFNPVHMAVTLRQVIDAASFYILSNPSINTQEYSASLSDIFIKATMPRRSQ